MHSSSTSSLPTSSSSNQSGITSNNSTALTPEQQQVVAHAGSGHAKVVAVAGAGKTTTLLNFVLAQLHQGVPAKRMLILMYNKSAQMDFEQKLLSRTATSTANRHQPLPEVRTFHSLGYRIYQRLIAQGHLPAPQGKILSDGEMEGVIWRLLQQVADEETKQDILAQKKKWVEPALGFIELVKSDLLTPEIVFEQVGFPSQCRIFVEAFYLFEQWRQQHQRISFSDMIYDPCRLFVKQPEIAQQFSAHMQWILVDEYQDINGIQEFLLKVLYGAIYQCEKPSSHLMVIGDPDQTIYEFRGSKPEYILEDFQHDFADERKPIVDYQLSHTFRYGHHLALLANCLIHHNKDREPVLCVPHSSATDTQVDVQYAEQYAQQVYKLVQKEIAKGRSPQDIVILNRLWGITAPIELVFLQNKMPYQLDHRYMVLDRFELDIFWYLFKVAANQYSNFDAQEQHAFWQCLLTTPFPKIKRPVLQQLAKDLVELRSSHGDLAETLWQNIPSNLSKWQKQALEDRGHIIDMAERAQDKATIKAWHLAQQYIDATNLYEGIEDTAFSSQQIDERIDTIKAFVQFLKEQDISAQQAYEYLSELKANHLASAPNKIESKRERKTENKTELKGVRLTSIHKAKGLEWPVVIIPALSHKYFPYKPEGEFATAASEESERRLLYVAMTRAKEQLYMIVPQLKAEARSKKTADKKDTRYWPSKFITEMQLESVSNLYALIQSGEGELALDLAPRRIDLKELLTQYVDKLELSIEIKQSSVPVKSKSSSTSTSQYQSDWPEYRENQWLKHTKLGKGKVLKDDEEYVTVFFVDTNQQKKLAKNIACHFLIEL